MSLSAFKGLVLLCLCAFVTSHEDHDEDQILMGYVKYPYQAAYHMKDTGIKYLVSMIC